MGSLIMNESNFQHILRVLNTNLDGKVKVMFALTSIKGVGRRFSNICCKKAEVDLTKRCVPRPPCPPFRSLPLEAAQGVATGGSTLPVRAVCAEPRLAVRLQGGRADCGGG